MSQLCFRKLNFVAAIAPSFLRYNYLDKHKFDQHTHWTKDKHDFGSILLKDTLLRWDFQNTKSDLSLFVLRENDYIILLLIYVDDIIITGSNNKSVETFITQLNIVFSLPKTLAFHTTSWELKYTKMLVECTFNKQSTLEIYSRSLIWKKLHLALHQW